MAVVRRRDATGLYAERDERGINPEGTGRQDIRGSRKNSTKLALALDQMVGWQDQHDVVFPSIDDERGERDGRGRIAPGRLCDRLDAGQLFANKRDVVAIGDDVDIACADAQLRSADNPIERHLEERPIAEQGQEGLGSLGRGQRPEAGPAAARQDHDVHAPQFYGPMTVWHVAARPRPAARQLTDRKQAVVDDVVDREWLRDESAGQMGHEIDRGGPDAGVDGAKPLPLRQLVVPKVDRCL